MRHTILVTMGQALQKTALDLKQYVMRFGERKVTDYLQVFNMQRDDSNQGGFVVATYIPQEATQHKFSSDLSCEYLAQCGSKETLADANSLKGFWNRMFQNTLTIQNQGESNELHICFIALLDDSDSCNDIIRQAEILKQQQHSFCIDVLSLPPSFDCLITEEATDGPDDSVLKSAISNTQVYSEARKASGLLHEFLMIDNCNTLGIALDLNYDTLIRIMGEYIQIAVEKYTTLFPLTMVDQDRDCLTFGMSILNFDKYYFIHYLLKKAYIDILGREKVDQTKVDINKVAAIAQSCLQVHYHRFSSIFTNDVEPLIHQGLDSTSILQKIAPEIEKEKAAMSDDFLSFIQKDELSLPEKQATLAQLLGLNDALYSGSLFNDKQLVFEDCGSDAIKIFVDEDNQVRQLAKEDKEFGRQGILYTMSGKDLAYLPVEELKSSRLRQTESDRYIRQKVQELQNLRQQVSDTEESTKRLTEDGFVYGNVTYRVLPDTEVKLFEETYKPHNVSVDKVDMRGSFTAIRDQGELGACSVFALLGVYEFLLKKLGKEKTDLSERFVYWNAVVDTNGEVHDDGTSFVKVADILSNKGVCLEEFCPYSDTLEQPSARAFDEALNHQVKQIKNVAIGPDIVENHKSITSALADGYPVIISLKLFDSFGVGIKGFVSHPTLDEKQQDKHGNHAMVICGFRDEEKVYIVRNSWGTSFGDKGYCYIPYSYIDDSDFCNQACIITQIAESDSLGGLEQKPSVSFASTDADIRYAITKNLIEEERISLDREKANYTVLASAYYRLTSDLDNNAVRRQILTNAMARLDQTIAKKKQEKQEFINCYSPRLGAIKSETKRKTVILGLIIFAFAVVGLLFAFIGDLRQMTGSTFWTIYGITFGLVFIGLIAYRIYRKGVYNSEERNLDHRRDNMSIEVKLLEPEKEAKHLKLHIAGMMVERINEVQKELNHRYEVMKGYVLNLATWMEEELEDLQSMTIEEKNPFVPIIDNSTLDNYFEERHVDITEPIRLYRYLDHAGLSDEEIIEYKMKIRDQIANQLATQFANFSMLKYILGKEQYPYLSNQNVVLNSLFQKLDQRSDCFLQLKHTNGSMPSKYIMAYADSSDERNHWNNSFTNYFRQSPSDVGDYVSRFKLVELQTRQVSLSQISWIRATEKNNGQTCS